MNSKSISDNTDQILGKRRPGRPPIREETIEKQRKRHEREVMYSKYADHINDIRFSKELDEKQQYELMKYN